MILSGLKTWLETGQTLTTPGSLMYGDEAEPVRSGAIDPLDKTFTGQARSKSPRHGRLDLRRH